MQKGVTTSHFDIQLDPFAIQQTICLCVNFVWVKKALWCFSGPFLFAEETFLHPEELRNVHELGSFKRQLKTVLFNYAYKCDTYNVVLLFYSFNRVY